MVKDCHYMLKQKQNLCQLLFYDVGHVTIRISVNHRIRITESQNSRGWDLCGSSSPTLLPKQGHLQQAIEDLVQAGLEYLQRRRLHNLPGQSVPVLRHNLMTSVGKSEIATQKTIVGS